MNKKLKTNELQRVSLEEFKQQDKFPIILVLDNIRSLNNIGSMFRTADGLNIEEVCLCGITAQPPHREINKTALGATDAVRWRYFNSALAATKELQNKGWKVYALEQAEKTTLLQNFEFTKNDKVAIVVGNEVDGVSQEVIDSCNGVLEIPQFGTKHSFNVSISAGMILWHLVQKLL